MSIVDDVAKPHVSTSSQNHPTLPIVSKRLLTGSTRAVALDTQHTHFPSTEPASPSRGAASETQTHPQSFEDTGEGPDWGVVLATGNDEEALLAASSAVRDVANTQQTSSDGFRLIEALEAAEAAFDTKHAAPTDAPRTSAARPAPTGDNVATSTVATSGACLWLMFVPHPPRSACQTCQRCRQCHARQGQSPRTCSTAYKPNV